MGKTLQFGSRQTGVCEQQKGQTNTLWKENIDFFGPLSIKKF